MSDTEIAPNSSINTAMLIGEQQLSSSNLDLTVANNNQPQDDLNLGVADHPTQELIGGEQLSEQGHIPFALTIVNGEIVFLDEVKEMEDFSVEKLAMESLKKWGATLNNAKELGFQEGFADDLIMKNLYVYFAYRKILDEDKEKEVKVTASDDLTREGVQSKFRDLENELYDKGNDKVECKDFPGLEQALKNTAWRKTPDYLQTIAIQIEKDRGKTTHFFHIPTQVLVCAAIKEMGDFSVEELDWDTLKKWGATLNYAEKFGFQVRFADNLLKEKLLAYFAVQNLPKSTAKK
ncbi:hypothetical protein CXB51_029517 [Gossypium anomalum]|uniref:Uncharacterized protein n=1 Tax=Gossypium anomalum TaxID=47600 RepID=A0A8J5YIS8_9ROSI|nr:hypothetical protein CXB51_029517 [Gossypium anomalum]